MASCDAKHIKGLLLSFFKDHFKFVSVDIYYPKWRWSKAIGYTTGERTIFINGYRLPYLADSDILELLTHELIHILDAEDRTHSFGHGNNKAKGKENTAPYWIGSFIAEKSFKNKEVM
jgi:hypothetical protein